MTISYADYTYYAGTFLGTAIASADFARLALRASAQIDQLTFNRAAAIVTAATDLTTIAAIKDATCAVAEEYQAIEQDGSTGGIVSESVGSYSVSYAENAVKRQSSTQRYTAVARIYLGSTGLMFSGFASGEYGSAISED
jgi:hypothetical protein